MLRPANRVTDGGCLVRTGGIHHRLRDFKKHALGHSALLLYHLRGVASIVPFQHLEDAARMLQCWVGIVDVRVARLTAAVLGMAALGGMMAGMVMALLYRLVFIEPCGGIVEALLLIPAGEVARAFLGIFEVLAQDRRRVGVLDHVLVEVPVVLEDVMDKCAEENNVAAGAQRRPDVRHRRGTGEPRVHMDDLSAALARLDDPLQPDRVLLCHGRAHDQDRVGISQ